ncbi:MAG TPA: ABC transporter ATP-binding protein [Candidatus Bathyarchaeia archaeon]|nr:ABC transporter ATP-binding protein [Candidatus Bathyarchaeia archaeon]
MTTIPSPAYEAGLGYKQNNDPTKSAVSVSNLRKTYPGGTQALNDISFSVGKGHVFCLLGRNGAGKTTLLRILATQLRASGGSGHVLGHDIASDADSIRAKIAVVPQEARPQMMTSPWDHVFYQCLIAGMSRPDAKARTREVLELLGLWEHKDKLSSDLSGGLRQRIIIGMALTGNPELIFLDEPTIGLDPLGRRMVWSLIREMTRRGVTVMLTTHYMDEAESLADNVGIIEHGKMVFIGTVEQAKAVTEMKMRVLIEPLVANNGSKAELLTPDSNQEILQIIERGLRENMKVTFKPPTLEDAFIKLVGGTIED